MNWQKSLTHWVIVLGDQPHVRISTLRALLAFGAANPDQVCQPARLGHARHPVLMPKSVFLSLQHHPAPDLRQFLESQALGAGLVESNDPGLDLDMDTPEDYERAQRIFLEAGS